jgi:hypothetical protein
MTIPKDEWKWYGFPGHHVLSERCAYHLQTRVGDWVVSTVGAFFPAHDKKMDTVGPGPADFYETIVKSCSGEDEHGNPLTDDGYFDQRYYADSHDAEQGHYEFCERAASDGIQFVWAKEPVGGGQ